VSGLPLPSFAVGLNPDNEFDKTSVLADLQGSTVGGVPFSYADYPYDSDGTDRKLSVLNFTEYCFSYYANAQSNYGLYVYLYNPQAFSFSRTLPHVIELAVTYGFDGLPATYEKFELRFLSVSSGAYAGLFYKFRIIDRPSETDGRTILQRVVASVKGQNLSGIALGDCARRYDISGLELRYDDAFVNGENRNKLVDHAIGGIYSFNGFASGYGPDSGAGSTLDGDNLDIETISLDVKSTYWRTDNPSRGEYAEDQLTSVYFSVPDYYIDTYGDLYGIRAEWYEYKTTPIVVSSSGALNGYIPDRLGLSTVEDRSADARHLYYNYIQGGSEVSYWGWSWNPYNIYNGAAGAGHDYLDKLYWFFYDDDLIVEPYQVENFLKYDASRTRVKKGYSAVKGRITSIEENSFFLEAFGRNDFEPIDTCSVLSGNAINYMLKYVGKSGNKIMYSRHIPDSFFADYDSDEDFVVTYIDKFITKCVLYDDIYVMTDEDCAGGFTRVSFKGRSRLFPDALPFSA
jgi:hypothetical protein